MKNKNIDIDVMPENPHKRFFFYLKQDFDRLYDMIYQRDNNTYFMMLCIIGLALMVNLSNEDSIFDFFYFIVLMFCMFMAVV